MTATRTVIRKNKIVIGVPKKERFVFIPPKTKTKKAYYRDAMHEVIESKGAKKGWKIIHGLIRRKKYGKEKLLEHAWAEKGNKVFDRNLKVFCSKTEYYKRFKVNKKACIVYDYEEAREYMFSYQTYGPWV
jgi:hypothetical protein